jgi:hypothetical protein
MIRIGSSDDGISAPEPQSGNVHRTTCPYSQAEPRSTPSKLDTRNAPWAQRERVMSSSRDETLRKDYARRINSAWRKSVAAIIEAGRLLVEAKTKLKPGTFTEMIIVDLGFDLSTAERLMKISRTPWLVESATLPILPAAWTTLYALSQLSKKEFDQAGARTGPARYVAGSGGKAQSPTSENRRSNPRACA